MDISAKREPSLVPLQQWFCDSCGEVISEPSHGYIEWRYDEVNGARLKTGIRIVHHALYSPNRSGKGNCYYSNAERGGDLSLTRVVGPSGRALMLSWLWEGENHDDEPGKSCVADLKEWTTVFRRLHIPYFEEANQYLARAFYGEFGEYANTLYDPETLRSVIRHYREEDLRSGLL
jgi:hypothetical protein